MAKEPIHVSLVVFPECDPSIIYGVFDTLWAAGKLWNVCKGLPPGRALFEPRLVSAEPGPLKLVTGVSIIPQDTIADVGRTDVVFVPNVMVDTPHSLRSLDRRLLDWIVRMHDKGAQLYAACGGSLVLAEAGLLDGHQATTHWSYAPLFRREFPNVALHEDRILVQAGPGHSMVCSGGASSWQDLALLLVAKYGGTEEAIRMSKIFLYQWHRDGQLPYASMIQNVDHGDAVIVQLPDLDRTELRATRHRGRTRQPIRVAEAHLRPAVQGGDGLFAAGLHPGAARRGSQARPRNECCAG